MKIIRIAILSCALIIVSCSLDSTDSVSQRIEEENTMSVDVTRAALEFVVSKLLDVHAGTVDGFSEESRVALEHARAELEEPVSEEALFFILNGWLTSFHDAHLEIRPRVEPGAAMDCADLPLSWRPQGLIVLSKTPQLSPGDKIVSLGGYDEASLLEALRRIIPTESENRLKFVAANRLAQGTYLRYLNALDDRHHVPVIVERTDGNRADLFLPLQACPSTDGSSPWVGYDVYENASLAIFWLDRFDYNQELVDVMEAFFAAVDEKNIEKVAVDLRRKDGGDSTVAFAFLQHFEDINYQSFSVDIRISDDFSAFAPPFAPQAMSPLFEQAGMPPIAADSTHYILPAPFLKGGMMARMHLKPTDDMIRVRDKKIFMLTDAGTFSSGHIFASLLRDNGIGILVGEPTGNSANFNGNEMPFDIPGTGFYLNMSTTRIIRPDPTLGDAAAIAPDIAISTSRDHIASGTDPQLDYLKSL